MAKTTKPKAEAAEPKAAKKLAITRTINLPVSGREQPVKLIRGHEYTVVADRSGPPVSELSRTIWESYAGKAEALMAEQDKPSSEDKK